ncbi:DoxX family protein [Ekhidna sp.]|uniref:DoxX family protein n=1 Tax=Ekhidna sp. TaxID=2608089 RepID=UPI003B511BDA
MKIRPIFHAFKTKDLAHIIPRLIVAIILAQTLPFKFSGAEESVWIFERIGWEPWGRYLIASIESVATIFLLTNYYIIGSIISLSIISAANFLHFTKLGFIVNDDGGSLFIMSIIVIFCSLWIVVHWNMQRVEKKTSNFEFKFDNDEDLIEY